MFLKEIILNKMKHLTTEEIVTYGRKYGFEVTDKEANLIRSYLKQNRIDPFKERDRKIMLKELARITDTETAKKANKLFLGLVKQYGLESMME